MSKNKPPERFFGKWPKLTDPMEFVEDVRAINWYVRWLIGYCEELQSTTKTEPDGQCATFMDRLKDVSDRMAVRFSHEIGDHALPKGPKALFSEKKPAKTAVKGATEPDFDFEDAKMEKILNKLARKRRKKRKNRVGG